MISTLGPNLTFPKVPDSPYLISSHMPSFGALLCASRHSCATAALAKHQAPHFLNQGPPNTRDMPAFPGPTVLTCSWGAGVRRRHTAGTAQQDHTLQLLSQPCYSKQQVLSFCGRSPACPACVTQYCRHSQSTVCRLQNTPAWVWCSLEAQSSHLGHSGRRWFRALQRATKPQQKSPLLV